MTKARKVRTVAYQCDKCGKTHDFTLVRHNKVVKYGTQYRCGICGGIGDRHTPKITAPERGLFYL